MEKKLLKRIEGMEEGEREKLRELLKDGKKPDEGRLAWMYKDKVENDEYLLGRRIDSSALADAEPDVQNTPGALFSEVITRRSEMDMQVKMREDPLYTIRKKEEERRRRLLENPIKMKQLQKVVAEQKAQKKHKDKKKKKKKHKKSDSSDDDDDDLLRQYLSIVNRKKSAEGESQKQQPASPRSVENEAHRSSDRSHAATKHQSDRDRDKSRQLCHRRPRTDTQEDKHRRKTSHSSADDSKTEQSGQSYDRDKSKKHHVYNAPVDSDRDSIKDKQRRPANVKSDSQEREQAHSKHRSKDSRQRRSSKGEKDATTAQHRARRKTSSEDEESDDGDRKVNSYGLILSSRAAVVAAHKSKTQTVATPTSQTKSDDAQPTYRPPKRKLTEDEMAAKRAEMMSNARERDEQRAQNVKRYRDNDERDRRRTDNSTAATSFVQPMMAQHASESSVEDRIKRNVYNIQRTSAQLDKNFARH